MNILCYSADSDMEKHYYKDDKEISPETVRSLLFVDDEENILSSLKRLFRSMGYELYFANNGAKGLQILQQYPVDLVVSDMRMPEMDGAEFLSRVAEQWPDTMRILLTGQADLSSTIKAINNGQIYYYVSKPWDDNDIKLVIRQALEHKFLEEERHRLLDLTRKQNEELTELNNNLEAKVLKRTKELRKAMEFLEKAHKSLKNNYDTTIRVFSSLIELSEDSIAGHSHRVAELADGLSIRLGLNEQDKKTVVHAALLHDIGKLGMPSELINTPFKSLKPKDQLAVLEHSVIGQTLLMALEPLHDAAQLIRSHHERYDGLGYPDRLSGEHIPLNARILTVVNDYDALVNGSLESIPFSDDQARNYLLENKGTRYDPAVVNAFIELLSEIKDIDENTMIVVETKDLKPGMVIAKDILTTNGLLLLPKGYILTNKVIDQIRYLERKHETTFIISIQKTRT